MMGVAGLCFFWPPIKHVQYYGILIDGECSLADRRWIVVLWVIGDSVLSILLLLLFIRPINVINKALGDSPRSVATLRSMRRMTVKNRNLLVFNVLITVGIYTSIAVLGNLRMRTVIWMCAVDRLVTLQCITMTFAYDGREYFYCRACFILCFQDRDPEIDEDQEQPYQAMNRTSSSPSFLAMSSSIG